MEAPRIPSFFKPRRPKEFNYRPWYYDPAKEAREKRNKMLVQGKEKYSSGDRELIRSTLHEKWRQSNSGSRQRNKSNLRLIIIIAALVWIFYFLLT